MNARQKYWVLGSRYKFLLSSPSLSVLESESWEGQGPPPHIHELEDESFYVLEGRLEVLKGDEILSAQQGDFVNIPKGVLHTFKTVSSYARALVTISPGGFEELFRLIGHPAGDEPADPNDIGAAAQKLMELAPRFRLIIPPPRAQ
jgi:quercetin dioxygenase-like cupin family protein